MRVRVIAAVSVTGLAGVLALSFWLLARSGVPEEEPTAGTGLLPDRLSTRPDEPAEAQTASPEKIRATGPPKPPIPGSLSEIFDETRGAIARMKVVDALPDDEPAEALAAIRWLLRKSDDDEALRNSAARKLLECGEEHLAADLAEMLWDERETPKWRNYCAQFLKDCYDRDRDPAVLDTIFKATEADEKMVRICAVWSLARVATPRDTSRTPDEATLKRIRTAALDALREKDAHFLITTAGVQSCARLGLAEALPDVRRLAGDENTKPTHLRVVSLAALGDLGDAADLPLLDGLAEAAKGQLKSAAAFAAKKIRKRAAEQPDTPAPDVDAPAVPPKAGKAGPQF